MNVISMYPFIPLLTISVISRGLKALVLSMLNRVEPALTQVHKQIAPTQLTDGSNALGNDGISGGYK